MRSTSARRAPDKGPQQTFSREALDELDWLENQRRPAEDVRGTDRAFLAGVCVLTLIWGLIALGSMTGAAAWALRLLTGS